MKIRCPRCGNSVVELLECDICKTIGCVKCVIKYNKQWVCEKCKSGTPIPSSESRQDDIAIAMSSLFG